MTPSVSKMILGTPEIRRQVDIPTRTYRIDFDKKRISGMVDGKAAMQQAVRKILQTERFAYLIYSWNYGMEWSNIIGKNRVEGESTLRKGLEDALLQDERITALSDLAVTRVDRRTISVTATVDTIFGAVREEITAHV